MEKVTKDAEVNFEEPIHKKNKYKKYRIFTEPSSPKSSNPER